MRTLIIILSILQASLFSVCVLAEKNSNASIATETEAELMFAEGRNLFYQAEEADDIERGYVLIKNAAEYGLGKAQAMLGLYYHVGVDEVFLKPNYDSSKYWFEKALNSNEYSAYMGLAMLYIEGVVIEQNLDHAVELLIKGAESGHLGAQEYLGDIYRNGYFKTFLSEELLLEERFINTEKAFDVDSMASKNGSLTANHNLAKYHLNNGNFDKTHSLFQKSIEQGNNDSLYDYGILLSQQYNNETSLLKGFEYLASYLESKGVNERESKLVYRFLRKYFLNPELDISKGAYNRLRNALNKPDLLPPFKAISILELIEPIIVRYQYQSYPNFDRFFSELKYEDFSEEHLFGWQLTRLLYLPLPVELTESFKSHNTQNYNSDRKVLTQLNKGVNEYLRWNDGHFVLKISNTLDLNIKNLIFSVPNNCDVKEQEANTTYYNISLGEFVLHKQSSQVYKVPIGLTKENDKCVSIVGVL